MGNTKAARVDALTGVRALAGLYILLLHFGRPLFVHAPAWLETMRLGGYLATSFFLLLSGFVLTFVYGARVADGRLDRRAFFAQRLARLYPSYALALVAMLPLAIVHAWGDASAAFGAASLKAKLITGAGHVLMLHAWVPRLATSWNVPDWCVSVEIFFYLTFPLLAPALLKLSPRRLLIVLLAAFATSLSISIGYTLTRPDGFVADAGSYGFYIALYKFCPLVRWPEFVVGVALGALYHRLPAGRRLERLATPLLVAAAVAGVAVLLASPHIPYTILHNGTLVPLYAVTVWALACGSGPVHRFLSLRPLTTLGNASFALYVLQVPVMMWLLILTGRAYPDMQSAPFALLFFGIMIPLAVLAQRHFERPAQEWLRARLDPRAPAPAPTPSTALPTEAAPVAASVA
jgi:peptidoglycan/LPS O-acetylase OafA/YrhL